MNVMKYDCGNRYAKTVLNIHALLQSCLYLEMKERKSYIVVSSGYYL